jgi:hypothetical protein
MPIAVLAVGILTIWALIPTLIEPLARDPLEVSFRYSPSRPLVGDGLAYLFGFMILSGIRFLLFIMGLITGFGILRKHRWSWYAGLITHVIASVMHAAAIVLLADYSTILIASLIMSLASLYLLTRKDVVNYLRPIKT